ncbi:MAG: preprotein translocase subunit YajC [Alphaproteobacteria bacterium]|nr:preprotein translocase subunit YajC [Alphaproteobacteria bacterium]OJV17266.1 MAG: preprotein translocase subunit YajC [Alphaproteobacteria bacterium 33-17]
MSFLPLVVIFAVMYFLVIRPQNKKQKEHHKMVNELKKGDKVVLTGGMIGIIVKVEDEKFMQVEIAQNVKVRFLKSAVAETINDDKKALPSEE